MHNIDLILTIAAGLVVALVLGYGTQRLGLSPIVGYLLAGIVVGPFTPGYVANHAFAQQLAEIGIVLLMFGVGLRFHISELLAVRRIALPGAVIQSLVATLLGMGVGAIFGWSFASGVVFGLSIAVASTVVMIRLLTDNNQLSTPIGTIAVGWLVVQDLFTVVILVILPVVFGPERDGASGLLIALGVTIAKVVGLIVLMFMVVARLLPWILDKIAATKSQELFNLAILAIALGIAVASTMIFDVSMALGAFLAGMVVARSEFSLRAATEVLPMRDAFAVLFFVSVGMLFNPFQLIEAPLIVIATLGVILIGNSFVAMAIILLLKYPLRVALSVGLALTQIGEFSFILVSLGADLGLLGASATNAVITAAIIAITLNPIIYRLVGPIEAIVTRHAGLKRWLSARVISRLPGPDPTVTGSSSSNASNRSIVVGYGPVGRTVARLLRENRVEPIIVEMNLETVRALQANGEAAIYGNATHRDILITAGVVEARSLIISVAGLEGISDVARIARELNPEIWMLARTTYSSEVSGLRESGVEDVFSSEEEVALALTTAILNRLGASPAEIIRERERLHAELGEQPDPHTSKNIDDQ